jgi:hypothetical protein
MMDGSKDGLKACFKISIFLRDLTPFMEWPPRVAFLRRLQGATARCNGKVQRQGATARCNGKVQRQGATARDNARALEARVPRRKSHFTPVFGRPVQRTTSPGKVLSQQLLDGCLARVATSQPQDFRRAAVPFSSEHKRGMP